MAYIGKKALNKRSADAGKAEDLEKLFETLRARILQLGPDVIEDARVHRSVYGKGSIIRSFAELFMLSDKVRLAVYTGKGIKDSANVLVERGPRWSYMDVKNPHDLDYALIIIAQSFEIA